MILHDNPASPYCRKVQVLARETGQMDRIELAYAIGHPLAPEKMPTDLNPLGKIPALVTDAGEVLFDSRVICRYLDSDSAFYPADRLFKVLTLEALADGIMDAAILMVYETRCRQEATQSPDWVESQWNKITRALASLEGETLGAQLDMGQIALACALGYLDFRHADRNWRAGHPTLAAWFEKISQRPSLTETMPSA